MSKNLTLVIMAAGMGSRFGGLKQIEPVGPNGEFIIDYSIYDAVRAGFNKVVFIIKEENYELFKETVGHRVEKQIKVAQEWKNLNDEKVNAPDSDYSQYDYSIARDKREEEIREKDEAKAESLRVSKKLAILQDRLKKIEINIKQGETTNHEHQLLIDRYRKVLPELEAHFKYKSEEIKKFYPKMEEFYRNNIEEWQY